MISGIFTAVLIVVFCGIVGWAYSRERREQFDAMARVPLIDDVPERRP